MKIVKCINKDCTQDGVNEYFMGAPVIVMCGVCQTVCELGDEYDDPQQPVMGQGTDDNQQPA